MAIKKSIKKKWIKALRSGKYEQGQTMLCDDDGKYCCLGVLAQIVDPDRKTWNGSQGYFGTVDDHGEPFITRADHNEQARLLGGCLPPGKGMHLTERNDDGASFKKIAWIIEKTKSI
jgi:hypothetical protein